MGHAQTKAKSKEAHSSNATAANSSGACKNKRRVVKELQRESNFDMVEVNQLYDIFNEMSGDSIIIIMWFVNTPVVRFRIAKLKLYIYIKL